MPQFLHPSPARIGRRFGFAAALVAIASSCALTAWSTPNTGEAAEVRAAQVSGTQVSGAQIQESGEKSNAAEATSVATKPWKMKNLPAFTPEREAAALTFVAAQHPELSPLLAHVKKSRPSEYEKVIRKLFVDSERLAHSRETQPQRYELELKNWQLESRIQLLVAKLTMDRTPALEQKLRDALAERLDVRRRLLAFDHDRHANRAASIDKQLAELDAKREKLLQEQFEKAFNPPTKKSAAKK